MTRQRTRTRSRPATTDKETVARAGGVETVSQQSADHKPHRTQRVEQHGEKLIAYVGVKDGVTLNMLDYNSFRRDINAELPVPIAARLHLEDIVDEDGNLTPEVQDGLDRVYNALNRWLGAKHEETVQDATEYFGSD